jgi:hypothetical protein
MERLPAPAEAGSESQQAVARDVGPGLPRRHPANTL